MSNINSTSTASASTNSAVDGRIQRSLRNNMRVLFQLRELHMIVNQRMDLFEKCRNETNSKVLKEGFDKHESLKAKYDEAFSKLPMEYRIRVTKRLKEINALPSSIKTESNRSLYHDLLIELTNKQHQLLDYFTK